MRLPTAVGLLGLASLAVATSLTRTKRAVSDRLVFAHYMLVTPPVNL